MWVWTRFSKMPNGALNRSGRFHAHLPGVTGASLARPFTLFPELKELNPAADEIAGAALPGEIHRWERILKVRRPNLRCSWKPRTRAAHRLLHLYLHLPVWGVFSPYAFDDLLV
jgi:hypothetical protein